MKKKIFAVASAACALVCGLCFTLTACGGGNDGPQTTGTLNKDENGKVIFDNVEIKLTTVVAGTDKQSFTEMINAFNKEYREQINVVLNCIYNDTYDSTVQSQIRNRMNPPDLMMSHQSGHLNYLESKLIQPFDEAMELSGITIDMKDYANGFAKYASLGKEGSLYSVPTDAQSTVILYNKAMLETYAEGKVPANRSEWLTACNAAKADGKKAILMSTTDGSTRDYIFPTAYLQNGGTTYNSDNRAEWASNATNLSAAKNAIASLRGLITDGLMEKGQSKEKVADEFLENKGLFLITTPWEVNEVMKNYAKKYNKTLAEVKADDIGAMSTAKLFAMGENANSANADKIYCDSHGFMMSITVTDINKKAAILEFIKWFTETGSIGAQWAEAGHISLSNKINADTTYSQSNFVQNYISKFYPDVSKLEGLGNTPIANTMITCFGKIMTDALDKTGDSQDEAIITEQQNTYNGTYDMRGLG